MSTEPHMTKELQCCFCTERHDSIEALRKHSAMCKSHPLYVSLRSNAVRDLLLYTQQCLPDKVTISLELSKGLFEMKLYNEDADDLTPCEHRQPDDPDFDIVGELAEFVNFARHCENLPMIAYPNIITAFQERESTLQQS